MARIRLAELVYASKKVNNVSKLASCNDYMQFRIVSPLNMRDFTSVQDFEEHAVNILALNVKNFYVGHTGAQVTTNRNKEAFQKYRIRPKVLRNVSERNISTKILGVNVSIPVGISPTAMQKWAHPDGELATAKAAETAGTIFILSTYSGCTIEEIAEAAPKATKWQQLSISKDRDLTIHIIKRAEQAGFKAIVATVDYPIIPKLKKNNVVLTESATFRIYEDYYLSKYPGEGVGDIFCRALSSVDDSLTWKDIAWLKSITKLPIVVKGVLTAEDALAAVDHGASAIIVSNHGGRQLESPPTTIEVLPEIIAAVGNKVEIYVDGGIRQGTDVFKALAFGAKMVFIGRPTLWGLACGGQEGVQAVLDILHNEIDETFAMAGCRSVQEVTRDLVKHEWSYSHL